MHKRHLVVLKSPDGALIIQPLKRWLRQHPEMLPDGLDAQNDTSYQLRRGLRKGGWVLEDLADRVLLIQPDENGDVSFADDLIESELEDDTITASEDELVESEEITFGLERDLQAALRANIERLEPGLKIIDGGKERTTEAGRIDITATDSKGLIVVIELKAGAAQPSIVAQILAYMASVSEADKKLARGIIVAGDFHQRVVMASRAIPNLELKQYAFQFTFRSVS